MPDIQKTSECLFQKQITVEEQKGKQTMPKKQTWQECQIYETKGIIDEVQSCRSPVCNKYLTTPFRYYFDYYKYCPHCGAKMDEEQEKQK